MIKICIIGLLFVVLFAAPFCVLPCKDSLEELLLPGKQTFTKSQNFMCTLGLVIFAYLVALTVPTIGDAMTILGATTNSGIGFLIPIVFYLKI